MTLSMTAYRIALTSFVFCMVALLLMLAPWINYLLGPELSIYDLGSPQLRAVV